MISLWRKHSYIILFIIVTLLMGIFLLFTSDSKENTNVSIKVEHGDSLWSISGNYADKLGMPTNELVKLIEKENKIYNKQIKTGDIITIPGLQIDHNDEIQLAYE